MLDVEHAMLAEKFQALLATEREAEKVCANLAAQMIDPAAREQVEQIHREKQRHVQLVERLLEIVE
jgi:rubrerythrin